MRVLITNWSLDAPAGTELYVRDLALALVKLGHSPIVYSPQLGGVAKEIRIVAIPVVDDLTAISTPPDVIHGHHYHETMTALLRFPGVPAVYVCHDWYTWFDKPPSSPRIGRYVAVDQTCYDKLTYECGIAPDRIRLMLNFVDLERFEPRVSLPSNPKRVLVYSSYLSSPHMEALGEACARAGLNLEISAPVTDNRWESPEKILGNYDIVLAKGRAALEALATGNAVIPYFERSIGPMVTAGELDNMLRLNLGARTLTCIPEPKDFAARVLTEIGRYDPTDAAIVSQRVRGRCGLDRAAAEFVSLYEEVVAEYKAGGTPDSDAEGIAAARYLQDLLKRTKSERQSLQVQNRQLAADCESLRLQKAEAEQTGEAHAEQLSHQSQILLATKVAELRNERVLLESEKDELAAALSAKELELARINRSPGWRILKRYGRFKYRFLLPAYRLLGLSRHITVNPSSTPTQIPSSDHK